MSAAPAKASTPYMTAALAIMTHPLAPQFSTLSIFTHSIQLLVKAFGRVCCSTIPSIQTALTDEYARTLPSVTSCPKGRQRMSSVGRGQTEEGAIALGASCLTRPGLAPAALPQLSQLREAAASP